MVTVPRQRAHRQPIIDRMPAIVRAEEWGQWLGEEPASVDALKAMLTPYEGDWDMRPQTKTPPPKKPGAQTELF